MRTICARCAARLDFWHRMKIVVAGVAIFGVVVWAILNTR